MIDSNHINQPRMLLNLGCGPYVKESRWLDCDGSWNVLASHLPLGLGWLAGKILGHGGVRFPRHVSYVNVTKRLPFPDGSIDAVYYSHVLEHLYLDEGKHLLRESLRVLKPGAHLRVLVPDVEHFARAYIEARNAGRADACLKLNEILMFRAMTGQMTLARKVYTAMTDFHSHKFMYDRHYLAELMRNAGFVDVRNVGFCESRIPEVVDIEAEERIAAGIGFGIEATRPATK